jgi:hypothetical protein
MKAVVKLLYNEPVVFLGALQGAVTAAAADGAISGWIPVVTLAFTTPILRYVVKPVRLARRRRR